MSFDASDRVNVASLKRAIAKWEEDGTQLMFATFKTIEGNKFPDEKSPHSVYGDDEHIVMEFVKRNRAYLELKSPFTETSRQNTDFVTYIKAWKSLVSSKTFSGVAKAVDKQKESGRDFVFCKVCKHGQIKRGTTFCPTCAKSKRLAAHALQ